MNRDTCINVVCFRYLFICYDRDKKYQINNDNNKTPPKMFYFSLLEYQIFDMLDKLGNVRVLMQNILKPKVKVDTGLSTVKGHVSFWHSFNHCLLVNFSHLNLLLIN